MKGRLIAFSGAAGVGKDTAAAHLVRSGFQKVAFADPLKEGLAAMLQVDRAEFEDRQLKEAVIPLIGKSPREMLQTLGTEWGRRLVHEDLWAKLAMVRVDKLLDAGIDVVMTDCRFGNEAWAVRKRGGEVVLIRRPGAAKVTAHASEMGLEIALVDMIIVNKSDTPEHFAAAVATALGVTPEAQPLDPVQAMAQIQQKPGGYSPEQVGRMREFYAGSTVEPQARMAEDFHDSRPS